jgi:glycosyltransferase involved in cell wall biosynthesis
MVGEPTAEKKEAFKMKYKKEGSLALQPDNQIKPQPKTIAAIPAYNEEKHIEEIVSKTLYYVDQVIVVDDGSDDRTGERARGAGAEVVTHDKNSGKGVAINTAFKAAREMNPQAMVLLDADGQHSPEEIPSLLDPVLNSQADMVVGSRFLKNNHIPKYRMLGQTVLNITTNLGSGIKLTDTQSGFRAFSRKAIEKMALKETGFAVESEMQFMAGRYGLKVTEVPIETNYDEKVKRSPVVHGFGVLFRVLGMMGQSVFNHSDESNKSKESKISQEGIREFGG